LMLASGVPTSISVSRRTQETSTREATGDDSYGIRSVSLLRCGCIRDWLLGAWRFLLLVLLPKGGATLLVGEGRVGRFRGYACGRRQSARTSCVP
jgi:hypothetical protein